MSYYKETEDWFEKGHYRWIWGLLALIGFAFLLKACPILDYLISG